MLSLQKIYAQKKEVVEVNYLSDRIKIDKDFLEKFASSENNLDFKKQILDIYKEREYYSLWIDQNGDPVERAVLFKNMVERYCFAKEDFTQELEIIKSELKRVEIAKKLKLDDIQLFDANLTKAFVLFISKKYPTEQEVMTLWYLPKIAYSIDDRLNQYFEVKGAVQFAEISYIRVLDSLDKHLKSYLNLTNTSEWSEIKLVTSNILENQYDERVMQVSNRIALLSEYKTNQDTSTLLTPEVIDDILIYRRDNGLHLNKVIDNELISSLNITPEHKLRQMFLNVGRLKWMPTLNFDQKIIVNIPEYAMRIYRNQKLQWINPVIVGKKETQTKQFTGQLKFVVFKPYWNIPPNIIQKEIVHSIKTKPGYLKRENLEIVDSKGSVINPDSINWDLYPKKAFPYNIRQLPGNENALGVVKFLFPNEYSIYMHDTQSKSLFDKNERAFSHGCIRVYDPQRLTYFILENEDSWDMNRVKQSFELESEKWVTLKNTMNVSIIYLTCWVNEKGHVNFRPDIYGLDAKALYFY